MKRAAPKRPASDAPLPSTTRVARALPAFACVVLLFAACIWSYAPGFDGVLVLDDSTSIVTNPTIRQLWPLSRHLAVPQEATVSGRPVANFTLAINYALSPADVREVFSPGGPTAGPDRAARFLRNIWGYHLLNLIIHLAAALALLGVVRRTLLTERMRPSIGAAALPLACVVALIWAAHPLQTAAVTYVVQRVESLMGLFFLLTLYCAIRAREGGGAVFWSGAAIASCALGMATKETMVSAPLLVVCWDVIFGSRPRGEADGQPERQPGGRSRRRVERRSSPTRVTHRWPLYVGLASTWLILALLVARDSRQHSVGIALDGWTPWTYLLTQAGVIVHYLRLAVATSPLVFLYTWPMARSLAEVAPQVALCTGLVVATVVGVARRLPLGFAGAWFFGILAPSSSVLPIVSEVAAEHRMYLPLAAVVATGVVGGYVLAREALVRPSGGLRVAGRITAIVAVVVAAALVLTLGSRTRARNRDYGSLERLWSDTVAKQPDNPRAHIGLGLSRMADGRYPEAEAELRTATRLDGANPVALGQLGATELALGKVDEAILQLEAALSIWPDYADAHRSLGLAYAARGDEARTFHHLGRAIQAFPDDPRVLAELGHIAAKSSDPALRHAPLALELAERAVRATSRRDARLLDQLASALDDMGRRDEAISAAVEALTIARAQRDPTLVVALERRVAILKTRRP